MRLQQWTRASTNAGWTLAGLYGLDRAVLEASIFPGLDLGANPGLLL